MCSLRDESSNFEKHNVQVFGITVNDEESRKKFSQENNLNFPLLLDTQRNLALLFGAAKKRTDERLKRITVIIDKSGKIAKIDKEVNPSTHGNDLVGFFKNMETSENN